MTAHPAHWHATAKKMARRVERPGRESLPGYEVIHIAGETSCDFPCDFRGVFLQCKDVKSLKRLAGVAGLEPATPGFGVQNKACHLVSFYSVSYRFVSFKCLQIRYETTQDDTRRETTAQDGTRRNRPSCDFSCDFLFARSRVVHGVIERGMPAPHTPEKEAAMHHVPVTISRDAARELWRAYQHGE